MRGKRLGIACTVLLAAAAAGGALPGAPDAPVSLQADLFAREGVNILYAIGNVRLQRGTVLVTADAAVIWTADQEAYLEGHIIYRTSESVLEAQRGYVHWSSTKRADGSERTSVDRGLLFNAVVRWRERPDKVAWHIRAEEVLQVAVDHFIARGGVVMAPCDFHEPHAFFRAKEVELVTDEKIIATDISYYVRGVSMAPIWVPPIYWPRLYIPLGWQWPELKFDFGSNSRVGMYAKTEVIYPVPGEIIPGFDTAVGVRLDFFSRRGPAYGGLFRYSHEQRYSDPLLETDVVRGQLEGYRMPNDRGNELGKKQFELGTEDRWRARFIHSQDMANGLEFDFEFNRTSDAGFVAEYFEREFEDEKMPENRAYLKYARGPFAAYIHARWQEDDWLDTTEYLPQIGLNVFSFPIWRNLLYTGHIEFANIRRELGDVRLAPKQLMTDPAYLAFTRQRNYFFRPLRSTAQEMLSDGRRFGRFDMFHQLSMPFRLGILHVEPFVATRQTYYEETLRDEGGGTRSILIGGARISAEFWRAWDDAHAENLFGIDWLPFQIDGIRHVVTPEIRILSIRKPSIGADELILTDDTDFNLPVGGSFSAMPYYPYDTFGLAFGDIDNIRPVTLVNLGLRNRWQTARKGRIVDFLEIYTGVDHYTDADRDNQGRSWSDYRADVRFTPVDGLHFFSSLDYNVRGTRGTKADGLALGSGVAITLNKRWQLFLAQRYEAHTTNRFGARLVYLINPKWRFMAQYEVDTMKNKDEEGNPDSLAFILTRDLHDWIAEFIIENHGAGIDKVIGFRLRPKARRELTRGLEYTRDLRGGMLPLEDAAFEQYDY